MKYLLTFLILLSLNIVVSGQETFKFILENLQDEKPIEPLQLADGSFILPVMSRNAYEDNNRQKILHISAQGNILNQRFIENPEGSCHIHNLIYENDSTLIGIGEWAISGQNSKLWYICFDTSLKIRWEKKYETSNNFILYLRSFIDSDNHIVSCVTLTPEGYPLNGVLYFIKTSMEGDSVTARYEPSGNGPILFDLIESNSKYLGFVRGFSIHTQNQVLSLDKAFNLLDVDTLPRGNNGCITVKTNNDSSYYMTSNYSNDETRYKIAVTLFDQNNAPLAVCLTGKNDMMNIAGADISMDFVTKPNILVGGTANFDFSNGYYSDMASWFSLSSFDSLLNLRWTKYYGGDSYYVLRSIIATADGGALLAGTRYDYLRPDNFLDVYILKVDSAGIYTNIGENPGIKMHEAIVYPNPAHETLNIQTQLKEAVISMYDMNGKEILAQELQQGISNIAIQHLAAGLYFYRITSHGKFIESGKWVKE